MIKQLVLIDGKNYAYRMHWVHRFLSSRGRCTSFLFGGFNSLLALARQLPDAAFVFVWDGEGGTWRHRFSEGEYKAHRMGQTPNEEMAPLFPQIPIFQKVWRAAGFRSFCFDGLECDDLIGMLATSAVQLNLFQKVIVHSTDQDFYQLATDRIGIMRGRQKGDDQNKVMFAKQVFEEIELHPKDWVKVRALIGDPTDNIPHPLEGIGPKKAIKMIQMGLDPAVEDFRKLPYNVKMEFSPVGSRWKIIRSNYVLSHILRDAEHEQLDPKLKLEIRELLGSLTKESFLRNPRKLNDNCFMEFTEFIAEYELNELFGDRINLWKLP